MDKIKVGQDDFFKILKTTNTLQLASMNLKPGNSTGGANNVHTESDQWLYVIKGSGKAIISGEEVKIKKGDVLLIEKCEAHEIINTAKVTLRTISFYAPPAY